jgi:hypothetical protein
LLASACCWLPLGLVVFGVSSAGIAGYIEDYRLWFLGMTAGLLAAGFYFIYFRRAKCGPTGECIPPNPRTQRFNRTMLWLATAFSLAQAFFPN